MPTELEAQVAAHERQIAAIRKLIVTRMKMINDTAALNNENAAQIRAWAKAQDELLRSLDPGEFAAEINQTPLRKTAS
jgi:hypothetical protein